MMRQLHKTSYDDLLWVYATFGRIFFSPASPLPWLAWNSLKRPISQLLVLKISKLSFFMETISNLKFFWKMLIFCHSSQLGRAGQNRLKLLIYRLLVLKISKFVFSMKTILLNLEIFWKSRFLLARLSWGRAGQNKLKSLISQLLIQQN